MLDAVTMMVQSEKQTVSRIDLKQGQHVDISARVNFNTSVVIAQGEAHVEDRVISRYMLSRLTAGNVSRIFNEKKEDATLFLISSPPKMPDEVCRDSFVRGIKECVRLQPAPGEFIWELEGLYNGACKTHSVAVVHLFPNEASMCHYHPHEMKAMEGEGTEEGIDETYIVVKGKANLELGEDKPRELNAGDFVAIPKDVNHKIYSIGNEMLELVVTCARAWTPNCGVYLEGV
jgi:mannose-6-phosphate isomerase-like protein (cupin superfamily)